MSRTVLVTGGAKRIGAAIVRQLAAAGYHTIIHHHASADEAASLAKEVGAVGVVSGDLSDTAGTAELFARAVALAGGPIDALVNSASEFSFDRPERIDPTLAARLFAVNCTAPTLLASALAAQSITDGAVVNILDQKLANPNPDFFSYTLAKTALEGATTLMAQAFAPRVRVNAVSPGLTLPSGDQSAAEFDRVSRRNLLQRPVGADAVADAVVWLLGARSVTGQTVFVDCGQRFMKRDGDVMFEGRDA
ncbi:NAD(P)-dependent dehydrogenase, short-chain alcohol dehydrogenase family [Sphingomonas gellani]|uniref:NAD(P)-dependent dehydrogenase, short-chain alcohol dehydrogenase family n=1 Tax=Sphingomonas gellani TaxID=1166340 RepID=A0A1H7Y4Z1_9SPHN|nr:SDR family oxidoreductase [Sphingomonas gellani]SEM41286.1 NAD(P)-dependent dehydrogenase, short-chain alcohol dehydrogenase family [Sphingomonas gellani]